LVVYLSKNLLDFICLMSFLFPFYADELMTIVIRLKDRENLSVAHRRHLYQLLVNECKIPHLKISVGYGLLQLIIGISAILLKNKGLIKLISALLFYSCLFAVCSFLFRKKIRNFV
jgi:Fuc2NAc and GlcNAc transferase